MRIKLSGAFAKLSVYSAGSMLTAMLGFFLLPLYVRKLSVDEFGIFSLCESTAQFGIAVIAMGVPQAMLRWCADATEQGKREVVFNSLLTACASILFLWVCLGIFHKLFSQIIFASPLYSHHLLLISIYITSEVINLFVINLFRVYQRALLYTMFILTKIVFTFGLNVFFISYLGWGVQGLLYGLIIGSICSFLVGALLLKQSIAVSVNRKLIWDMLVYGSPIFVGILFSKMIFVADRFMLSHLAGPDSVATYSLALKIAGIMTVSIVAPFQIGFLPMAYEAAKRSDAADFLRSVFRYYYIALIFIGTCICIFSPEIVNLISNNKGDYNSTASIIPFAILFCIFDGLQYFFYIGLRIQRISRFDLIVSGIALAVNLLLNYLLMPVMGVLGAALVKIVTNALSMLLLHYFSHKYYPVNYNLPSVFGFLTVAVLAVCLSIYIPIHYNWPSIGLKLLIFFVFLIFTVRILGVSDLKKLLIAKR